ncbi:MAG: peptide chain release factor N(5)-glutamine methyltransferase [Deferribacteraceae bacterium]|jgi:release factor glutamine methyltransferase|nr:peptide chain release factor N(5)-glutamine methyltransferase [Deferribacteraceae bacterium]
MGALNGQTVLSRLSAHGLSRSDAVDIAAYLADVEYHYALLNARSLSIDEKKTAEVEERLLRGEPTAYITRRKEFYGLEFELSPSLFIPRPESELLTELAIKENPKRIMELCTGSGAILLSILSHLECAAGLGVDNSPEAIAMAERNADRLKLSKRALFMQADVLKENLDYTRYDLIVMNPPYLSKEEYAASAPSIFYEPKSALVAEEDGYSFYKNILNKLKKFNIMLLLLEIGAQQADKAAQIAQDCGFSVSVHRDLAQRERVIRAYKG